MRNKFLVCSLAIAAVIAISPTSFADTKDKKIALSNTYAGNGWRREMLESWDKTTKQAVADGIIAAADPFTTSENQATEQAAQIHDLIRRGYNAIVINAASPDALNSGVKEACDAGIVVVSFDGIVREPCAYRISVDLVAMGKRQVDYLNSKIPKGGNLLEIRGLADTISDTEISKGIGAGVEEHKQFKIVKSVHGDWSQEAAQNAVSGILPSLPEIAAVVTQGGDGLGVAKAFKAAGRPMPMIVMGNRKDELLWWKEQKDANGYETTSVSVAPGVSTFAFWIAQMILDGKKVPKDLTLPLLQIDQVGLEKALSTAENDGVANVEYSAEDTAKAVAGK